MAYIKDYYLRDNKKADEYLDIQNVPYSNFE